MRLILAFVALALVACGQSDPPAKAGAPASAAPATAGPPASASVHFVWPQDGSTVFSEFTAVFGVTDMTITPAGEKADDKSHGHHHLIINGGPIEAGKVVPMDEKHLHFGKAQTEALVKLPPGKHTLTMQLADGNHISYGPKLATTITVNVVPLPTPPPRVFFVAPADGAQVQSPVKLQFGLESMSLSPAGEKTNDKTTGHHHVIIDGAPVPAGKPVPADEKHIHFGKAQTEAEIALAPGKHTLTLQLADGLHLSYGPALSATISVEVVGGVAPVSGAPAEPHAGHGAPGSAAPASAAPESAAPASAAPASAAPESAAPESAAPGSANPHEGHKMN